MSLIVHGSLGYAMLPSLNTSPPVEAFVAGTGTDELTVEQGIAIEGLSKLGDAMETIETAEITPVEAPPPPPLQEIKELDELKETITSTAGEVNPDVVKLEEPPPPPPPEVVQPVEVPQQVAVVSEQSSGAAKTASGDPQAYRLYLGKINEHVQRAKINPRSRVAGTVVLRYTVNLDGGLLAAEVVESSGSKVLDEAATAAIGRAAPFPPIPPDVSQVPVAVTQAFKFVVR